MRIEVFIRASLGSVMLWDTKSKMAVEDGSCDRFLISWALIRAMLVTDSGFLPNGDGSLGTPVAIGMFIVDR